MIKKIEFFLCLFKQTDTTYIKTCIIFYNDISIKFGLKIEPINDNYELFKIRTSKGFRYQIVKDKDDQ